MLTLLMIEMKRLFWEKLRTLYFPKVLVLEKGTTSSNLDCRSLDGCNGTWLLDDYGDDWLAVIHGDGLGNCGGQCLECLIRRPVNTLQSQELVLIGSYFRIKDLPRRHL